MRFSINQAEMERAISVACAVADGNSVANLAAIQIKAIGGEVVVRATDQREVVEQRAAALVEGEGSVCVPARLLGAVVKSLPDQALSIYDEGELLHISCAKNNLTLPTNDSYEQISIKPLLDVEPIEVPAEQFVDAVQRVSTFACKDEKDRYPGVCLDCGEDGVLHVVATDSYKIAERSLVDKRYPKMRVFVPIYFVKHLKMLSVPGSMYVTVSDTLATFSAGDITLQTVLLQKDFPNWQMVMKLPESSRVRCNLKELRSAVNRVNAVGANTTEFKFDSDEVSVSGFGDNGSSSMEAIAACESEVAGIAESYVSTSLLQTVLSPLDGDEVDIDVYIATRPLIFHGERLNAVIMPVRKPEGR